VAAPAWFESEITRRQMVTVGLGVLGGGVALAGLVYLVQRQVRQGDVLQMRVIHDVEPETRAFLEQLRPSFEQAVEQGVDFRVRLFPGRETG